MRVLLIFLLTSVTIASAQTDAAKYTGLRYGPTVPKGIKYVGGSLISEIGDKREYGVAEVHKGRTKLLWFERIKHFDDEGKPYWELMDAIVVPPHPKGQVLVYSFCWMNNHPDKEIAAIVDYQADAEYFTRVRKAWRANRQTEKFEVIPTKGIKCENNGFGV
jgi:hypothetical protein